MAKKEPARKQAANGATDAAGHVCPKCGSTKLAGLMAAFWVSIDDEGGLVGQFSDYASDTEIGPERLCSDCEHEF